MQLRAVLKYSMVESGAQFAMTCGDSQMLMLCAEKLVALMALLKQHYEPPLVREPALSGLTMFNALALNCT